MCQSLISIHKAYSAFTLAELLIALFILSVIATYTIPKVLQSSNNARYNAIVKETAAMVSEAYMLYKNENTVNGMTRGLDLTPYFNYVSVDTSTIVDDNPTLGTLNCATDRVCLKLHNGAMLFIISNERFGLNSSDIDASHMLLFELDPDGKFSDIKSLDISLYYAAL